MSEGAVQVVRIGPVRKHPNADTLSVTDIHGGYPVIFRTGDYHEGDLAVYVPVDSIVPAADPAGSSCKGPVKNRYEHHGRVKMKLVSESYMLRKEVK